MDILHTFATDLLNAMREQASLVDFILLAVVVVQTFALWLLWTANQKLVREKTAENLRRIEEARESRRHLYSMLAHLQGRVALGHLDNLDAEDQATAEMAARSEP